MTDKKPTIDERLEAIVHSLELVAQMQIKTERSVNRLGRYVRTIAADHEARLLSLEGENDDNNNDEDTQ